MSEHKLEIVNFGIDNEKFQRAVAAYGKFQSDQGIYFQDGKYSPEGKLFVEQVTEYIEYCFMGGNDPIPYDQEADHDEKFFMTSYNDKVFFFEKLEDAKTFWNVLDAVDGYFPSVLTAV
ncbi:hypothetical protein [Methanococcoides methylutens]|uniref:Uncharacterized protein n=1 Tax=Methanococcoides methylutens MM1 TaxID=1434104 RepID=A0A0E3WZ97_METMT|nr:hypothetical protein [Methanococcoides methylutens]AKB84875.1 hypothetical protein MCMEM_0822 [Methanococcoides methylutens MM1]